MKALILLVVLGLAGGTVWAQSLLSDVESGGSRRLMPFDAAVLSAGEPRNDLPCDVLPLKAQLDFDFLFHTGYRVSIPLKDLAGAVNELTILFRVAFEKRPGEPVYFAQKFRVPSIDENSEGNALLDGEFLLGEGKYHVDWLVRDFEGHLCARFWDLEAKASDKEGPLAFVEQGAILPAASTPFREDLPVLRAPAGRPLSIKVIVNFAPQSLAGATLGPGDLNGLVSILRKIGRDPRIGSYSLVACSIQAQQIFYRQERAPRMDLAALGEALGSLSLGKIHIQQLAKNSETAFLSSLITDEMTTEQADGLIFVGPKYPLDSDVPREVIDRLRGFGHPVFYLNYILDPLAFPWRDAIGKIVKQLHGIECTITHPRDLFLAWSDIMSRLSKNKFSSGLEGRFSQPGTKN